MKKIVLIVMLVLGGSSIVAWGAAFLRADPTLLAQAGRCSIPRNYGSVKAVSSSLLIFEAPDGTVRVVHMVGCELVNTIPRS